jgi:hypothetical protein
MFSATIVASSEWERSGLSAQHSCKIVYLSSRASQQITMRGAAPEQPVAGGSTKSSPLRPYAERVYRRLVATLIAYLCIAQQKLYVKYQVQSSLTTERHVMRRAILANSQ